MGWLILWQDWGWVLDSCDVQVKGLNKCPTLLGASICGGCVLGLGVLGSRQKWDTQRVSNALDCPVLPWMWIVVLVSCLAHYPRVGYRYKHDCLVWWPKLVVIFYFHRWEAWISIVRPESWIYLMRSSAIPLVWWASSPEKYMPCGLGSLWQSFIHLFALKIPLSAW